MTELADLLRDTPDLSVTETAVRRERAIRDMMARSAEGREVCEMMVDSDAAMVTEYMARGSDDQGEPTTLRGGLEQLVAALETEAPN